MVKDLLIKVTGNEIHAVMKDWPGGIPYTAKKGKDACQEISNEPLKGTSLGVA